jgi:hypothetical protein
VKTWSESCWNHAQSQSYDNWSKHHQIC